MYKKVISVNLRAVDFVLVCLTSKCNFLEKLSPYESTLTDKSYGSVSFKPAPPHNPGICWSLVIFFQNGGKLYHGGATMFAHIPSLEFSGKTASAHGTTSMEQDHKSVFLIDYESNNSSQIYDLNINT